MNLPRTQTLRDKLIRLTAVAVAAALLVTGSLVALYEYTTFRPRALDSARAQAELVAGIVVPAIEFDDPDTARKLLEVLRHERSVESAGIYGADGHLMATYRRDEQVAELPALHSGMAERFVGNKLVVAVRIRSNGVEIGRVWLQASLPSLANQVRQYAWLMLVVGLAALVLGYALNSSVRRQITDPLLALSRTVRTIGLQRDLGLRVDETAGGEIGDLGRSFNGMLAAIEQRDCLLQEREARLVRHNAGLAQLNRTDLENEAGFTAALQGITELAAEIQDVARVGIWFLDEQREAITCADQFMRDTRGHTAQGSLARSSFPTYLQALDQGVLMDVHDARTDPRTREFADTYLAQHGIGAMLDAPILWRGRVMGVLCHEHVGAARHWHADETALAVAFAERISHLMERRATMRADAALRESEARYRDFITQAQDAIFTLSIDGRIQSVNDAVRRITGWELNTWLGQRFQRVLLPEDVALAEQRFADVAAGQTPPSFELRIRTRTGGVATLEFAVSPQRQDGRVVGLLGIGRDVSERTQAAEARSRLEEQLRHSQKMEAIGTMAGGIAHDFNNILTAIIGNAQIAEMDCPQDDPTREHLVQVLIASHRAKELVQQILAFSRRQDQALVAVSLTQVVRESLKLLRPVLASTIRIESRLPDDLPCVLADATQLHQVVVNLATNAAHALEEKGGLLELALDEVEVDLPMATLKPGLKPGRFVRLSLTDNGTGMSPAVQAKIFDPFFTTKAKGKGTGLGLAVVHGIVQQHGGAITVYSVPEEGTTFQVYLPAVSLAPLEALGASRPAASLIGRGEAVLVVDDEAQVVSVATAVLQRHGYRPVGYQNPLQALAVLRERPANWALVITDQLMPEMKGTGLAEEIWKIRPELPIILATGFAGNLDEEAILRIGFAGLLHKPFTKDSLLAIVAKALPPRPE